MVLSTLTHDPLASASSYYALPSLLLTPKFSDLLTRLNLVNTTSNLITCQGRCGNGGQCSQRLDQHRVARKVLEVVIVALGGEEELNEGLTSVYWGLLCGSAKHQTQGQVDGCVKKAKGVVEAWRQTWGVGSGEGVDEGDCKNCVELQIQLAEEVAELDKTILERDQLRQRVQKLEQEAERDLRSRERLQEKVSTEQKRAQDAEDAAQDLGEKLQSLQIKYDGLVGRMQEEVNMAKTPSPSPSSAAKETPGPGLMGSVSRPLFKFDGTPAQPHGTGLMSPRAPPEKNMNGGASSCSVAKTPTPSLSSAKKTAVGSGKVDTPTRPLFNFTSALGSGPPTPAATPEKKDPGEEDSARVSRASRVVCRDRSAGGLDTPSAPALPSRSPSQGSGPAAAIKQEAISETKPTKLGQVPFGFAVRPKRS